MELHVVSVGNSLLRHWSQTALGAHAPRMQDEDQWQRMLDDPAVLQQITAYLTENPETRSAEVRSLTAYMREHHLHPHDVAVYLVGTRTASNEIVRQALVRYLRACEFAIYHPKTVSGYFADTPCTHRVDAFKRGMLELLQHLIDITHHARREYAQIVFNPTGGFKAHVIVVALAAFMTGCPLYYIHEEFAELIEFPPMFYVPEPQEVQCLHEIARSGTIDVTKCPEPYLRRWIDFGLVEWLETKPPFRQLRLTARGRALLHLYPE